MTPFQKAQEVYENEPSTHTFEEALEYYLEHGFVHSTPEFFVMARPVSSDWPDQLIVNPMAYLFSELTNGINMWHIGLMAGDMRNAWKLFPYELQKISMERNNKLRTYDYARFRTSLLSR